MENRERTGGDAYDGAMRSVHGIPGVISTKPATVRHVHALLGTAESFMVQTYRKEHGEDGKGGGDTVFIEYHGAAGLIRLALPPQVADTIARQRAALTSKRRRIGAEKAVATRKERGIEPAFLRKKGAAQ